MKLISTGKWAYSVDGENFYYEDFDSKEEAVDFVKCQYGHGYVGQCYDINFDERDISVDLEYYLGTMLYDEVGDSADKWHLTSEEEAEVLNKMGRAMVAALNEMNLQPKNLFVIKMIEEVCK